MQNHGCSQGNTPTRYFAHFNALREHGRGVETLANFPASCAALRVNAPRLISTLSVQIC